jgi:hypothetical protein
MLKTSKLINKTVNIENDAIEELFIVYCKKYLPKKGYNKNLIILS